MPEDSIVKNMRRAGEFFVYSIWLQSQMTDLIILKKHPKIRKRFVERPAAIPATLIKQRMLYWTKDFFAVKNEFVSEFKSVLPKEALNDLARVYHLRNAIGHSYVSLARDYFLYKPKGGQRKSKALVRDFSVAKRQGAAKPILFKLSFGRDEFYMKEFAGIQRLDGTYFKAAAASLNVPHSRIR